MNINQFREELNSLIVKDNLEEAIKLLGTLLKSSPKLDQVLLQRAKFADLMKQIRAGVINFENAEITKNRLRLSILDIASEIEQNILTNAVLDQEFSKEENQQAIRNIIQKHYGDGDNVGGNKIVNL